MIKTNNYIFVLLFITFFSFDVNASSLNKIFEKGFVSCGVYKYNLSYSLEEDTSSSVMCKMFTYALFGNENALNLVPFEEDIRFEALNEDIIDISFATISWTMEREMSFDIFFPAVYFFEKQVFATLKSSGIKSLKTAPYNTRVCIPTNTTVFSSVLKELKNYQNKTFQTVINRTSASREKAFLKNRCEITSGELGVLYYLFRNDFKNMNILPEEGSFSPIVVTARVGNKEIGKFAKWLINGIQRAETLEINKKNIDDLIKTSKNKEILFMLGEIKGIGKPFNLDDKWLYRVIKKYGNYGESFTDIYGKYKVKRIKNLMYEDGGSFYSYPFM